VIILTPNQRPRSPHGRVIGCRRLVPKKPPYSHGVQLSGRFISSREPSRLTTLSAERGQAAGCFSQFPPFNCCFLLHESSSAIRSARVLTERLSDFDYLLQFVKFHRGYFQMWISTTWMPWGLVQLYQRTFYLTAPSQTGKNVSDSKPFSSHKLVVTLISLKMLMRIRLARQHR